MGQTSGLRRHLRSDGGATPGGVAAFVALYVLLDWTSFISPLLHLNVTPWNPAPALGLVFILRRGRVALAALFVSIALCETFLRHASPGLPTAAWLALVLSAGYYAIALLLKRHFPDRGLFADRQGLLRWSAIIILGSLGNSILFISQLGLTGLLPASGLVDAALRFWVGDVVGIFIAMPLFWSLQDRPRRQAFGRHILCWETLAYLLLAAALLWVTFVPGAEASFRYFYVLFLPLVWAASRQGLVGAICCVSVLQVGILVAGSISPSAEASLFELQLRAFLLALVGFLIGTAVDEQRRSAADLRNSLRLAAAGEMAGALAHELNQPLSALSAYGSACQQLLSQGGNDALLREVLGKMTGEAQRAANVVKRLRDFFRTGSTHLEPIALPELIDTALAPFQHSARRDGIELVLEPLPPVTLHGDHLQLEVVLRNLLANACEAAAAAPPPRQVRLNAWLEDHSRILLEITDSGPGVPVGEAEQVFEPFTSSKSSGLGLGLAISRAITEAHDGSLYAYPVGHGCFRLSLPVDPRSSKR